ncbi:MAG: class I SAM-dependent methyltransferase, partial [Candidatus Omnitrophica bacterium]|nr:class I SAM-dependent methyltransferase [Candidatus Omnitrophota bacterium]
MDEFRKLDSAIDDSFVLIMERLKDLIKDSGQYNILILGSDPGVLTREIARTFKNTRIFEVDIRPEMVKKNIEMWKRYGLEDRILTVIGDVTDTPFGNDYFDIVISHGLIRYIREKEKAAELASEIKRVLKPGGIALNGDAIHGYMVREFEGLLRQEGFTNELDSRTVQMFRNTVFYILLYMYRTRPLFKKSIDRIGRITEKAVNKILFDLAGFRKGDIYLITSQMVTDKSTQEPVQADILLANGVREERLASNASLREAAGALQDIRDLTSGPSMPGTELASNAGIRDKGSLIRDYLEGSDNSMSDIDEIGRVGDSAEKRSAIREIEQWFFSSLLQVPDGFSFKAASNYEGFGFYTLKKRLGVIVGDRDRSGHIIVIRPFSVIAPLSRELIKGIRIYDKTAGELIREMYYDYTNSSLKDTLQTITIKLDNGVGYYKNIPIYFDSRYTSDAMKIVVNTITENIEGIYNRQGILISRDLLHPLLSDIDGDLVALYVGKHASHPRLRKASGFLKNINVKIDRKDTTYGRINIGGVYFNAVDPQYQGEVLEGVLIEKGIPIRSYVTREIFYSPKVFRDKDGNALDVSIGKISEQRYPAGYIKILQNVRISRKEKTEAIRRANIVDEALTGGAGYAHIVLENDYPVFAITSDEPIAESPFEIETIDNRLKGIQIRNNIPVKDTTVYIVKRDLDWIPNASVVKYIPDDWGLWDPMASYVITGKRLQQGGILGLYGREISTGFTLKRGYFVEVARIAEEDLLLVGLLDQEGKVRDIHIFDKDGKTRNLAEEARLDTYRRYFSTFNMPMDKKILKRLKKNAEAIRDMRRIKLLIGKASDSEGNLANQMHFYSQARDIIKDISPNSLAREHARILAKLKIDISASIIRLKALMLSERDLLLEKIEKAGDLKERAMAEKNSQLFQEAVIALQGVNIKEAFSYLSAQDILKLQKLIKYLKTGFTVTNYVLQGEGSGPINNEDLEKFGEMLYENNIIKVVKGQFGEKVSFKQRDGSMISVYLGNSRHDEYTDTHLVPMSLDYKGDRKLRESIPIRQIAVSFPIKILRWAEKFNIKEIRFEGVEFKKGGSNQGFLLLNHLVRENLIEPGSITINKMDVLIEACSGGKRIIVRSKKTSAGSSDSAKFSFLPVSLSLSAPLFVAFISLWLVYYHRDQIMRWSVWDKAPP